MNEMQSVLSNVISNNDVNAKKDEKCIGDLEIKNMDDRLSAIDKEIRELENEMENVKGRPTEVYTRIVGYFRAIDNWNKGKKEEYFDRKLFKAEPVSTCDHICGNCVTEPNCAMSKLDHSQIHLQEANCAC
jgi:hypothetical protein